METWTTYWSTQTGRASCSTTTAMARFARLRKNWGSPAMAAAAGESSSQTSIMTTTLTCCSSIRIRPTKSISTIVSGDIAPRTVSTAFARRTVHLLWPSTPTWMDGSICFPPVQAALFIGKPATTASGSRLLCHPRRQRKSRSSIATEMRNWNYCRSPRTGGAGCHSTARARLIMPRSIRPTVLR